MSRTLQIKLVLEVEDAPREGERAGVQFSAGDLMDEDLVQALELASPSALTEALFGETDMAVRIVKVAASRLP